MKIRPFKKGDEGQLSDLIRDALHRHQYDFKGQDPRLIERDIERYSSAYIKELAQRASIYISVPDDAEHDILGVACLEGNELSTCYVRGDQQNKRVGTMLVRHIEQVAKTKGIQKIVLYSNFYSESFYESCGFQLIERTVIDYYGVPWNASYMEKDLT